MNNNSNVYLSVKFIVQKLLLTLSTTTLKL